MATVTVTGDQATYRRLMEFDRRTRKSAARKAVRAGGSVVLKAVRSGSPSRNRILKSSFSQKVKTYANGNVVSIIGQDLKKLKSKSKKRIRSRGGISGRGDVVPSHLVELPVKPHSIPGTRKPRINVFRSASGLVFLRSQRPDKIKHPGHSGVGFIAQESRNSIPAARKRTSAKLTVEVARIADSLATFTKG